MTKRVPTTNKEQEDLLDKHMPDVMKLSFDRYDILTRLYTTGGSKKCPRKLKGRIHI